MTSKSINPTSQLVLDVEPGLAERFRSLRDCIATGVYQRGLKRIAMELDKAPGNLSVELADEQVRHFSVDSLERYIAATGDMTPILYLAEKFMSDREASREAAQHQLMAQMADIMNLMKKAGVR